MLFCCTGLCRPTYWIFQASLPTHMRCLSLSGRGSLSQPRRSHYLKSQRVSHSPSEGDTRLLDISAKEALSKVGVSNLQADNQAAALRKLSWELFEWYLSCICDFCILLIADTLESP